MKVQVKYKHHYQKQLVTVPLDVVFPDITEYTVKPVRSGVLLNLPLDSVVLTAQRIERHPTSTTASVVIGDLTYSGNSRCHELDQFSKKEGREIALSRLVQHLIKCDFNVTVLNQFELHIIKRDVLTSEDSSTANSR